MRQTFTHGGLRHVMMFGRRVKEFQKSRWFVLFADIEM